MGHNKAKIKMETQPQPRKLTKKNRGNKWFTNNLH